MKRLIKTFFSFNQIAFKLGGNIFMKIYIFKKFVLCFLYWKLIGKRLFKFHFIFRHKSFEFFADNRVDLAALDEIFVKEEYLFNYLTPPSVLDHARPIPPQAGGESVPFNILDLGANIGDTAIFYSLLFPDAKVFAVEPNPQVHDKLAMNTKQFPNIKICKSAISDHTGKINLNFGDSHLGSSINHRVQNKNSVEVDVYSLEDFCKKEGIEKVDILKFDIEGAEEYLLPSLIHLPGSTGTPVVQIAGEMHDDLVSSPLTPMIEALNLKDTRKTILNSKRYIIFGRL